MGLGWSTGVARLIRRGVRPDRLRPGQLPAVWLDMPPLPASHPGVDALILLCGAASDRHDAASDWLSRLACVTQDPCWAAQHTPHLLLGQDTPLSLWWREGAHQPWSGWEPSLSQAPSAAAAALLDAVLADAPSMAPRESFQWPAWFEPLARQHPAQAHASAIRHSLPYNKTRYAQSDRQLPWLTQRLLDCGIPLASSSVSEPKHSAVACAVLTGSSAWVQQWVAQGGTFDWRCPQTQRHVLHLLPGLPRRGSPLGALHRVRASLLSPLADLPDRAGHTPLHLACQRVHVPLVEQLLNWGADPLRPSRRHRTPLAMVRQANFRAQKDGVLLIDLLEPTGRSQAAWSQALRSLDVQRVAEHLPADASARLRAIEEVKGVWEQSAARSRPRAEQLARLAGVLDLLWPPVATQDQQDQWWSWILSKNVVEAAQGLSAHYPPSLAVVDAWSEQICQQVRRQGSSEPGIREAQWRQWRLEEWVGCLRQHRSIHDPCWSGLFDVLAEAPFVQAWLREELHHQVPPAPRSAPTVRFRV